MVNLSISHSLALVLLLSAFNCFAQPKSELAAPPPLDPAEGERQARVLVAHLLEQQPEQPVTNTGLLKIRDREGNQTQVSARFAVVPTPTNWFSTYESAPMGAASSPSPPLEERAGARMPFTPGLKLTIVHADQQPNQYFLRQLSGNASDAPPNRKLKPDELMTPFAGSDFWIVDLGLEFLHWPEQRVLRKQMRKGLSCDVLQSVNPQALAGGYSRVLSWIAINRPEDIVIVHAEAFDSQDKLLKEFDPKKVEKVNGQWQLEEMEIRNRQAGTRTRIDFNLDGP